MKEINTIVLLLLSLVPFAQASCMWYGDCYKGSHSKVEKFCPYFGPAKDIGNTSAADFLVKRCSNLFSRDENGRLMTCCSPHQVGNLKIIFNQLEDVAGHCPACMSNIAHLFCGLTCASYQDMFMSEAEIDQPSASSEFELSNDPETLAIMRIRHPRARIRPYGTCSAHSFISAIGKVKVNRNTVSSIVKSCQNVKYHDKYVFEQIFSAPLTIRSLLNFIGNPKKNVNVAVRLGFVDVSDSQPALNFTVFNCEDVEPFSQKTCFCQDCPAACNIHSQAAMILHGTRNAVHESLKLSNGKFLLLTFILVLFAIITLAFIIAYRFMTAQRKRYILDDEIACLPSAMETANSCTGEKQANEILTDEDLLNLKTGFWRSMGSQYWGKNDYSTFENPRP